MPTKYITETIAFIELCIGFITLAGMGMYTYLSIQAKPFNVLIFVTITAVISVLLGVGLLRRKKWAATLLVFFSGYIILIKFMIAVGLLHFNGEMLTAFPADFKNIVSVLYHGFIIFLLTRSSIKESLR